MFRAILICCLVIACTHAFMFDNPCNIELRTGLNEPNGESFMSDNLIPMNCTNGNIRWDYPRGHGRVHFINQHRTPMSVCIKDSLGGDVFIITDITNGSQGMRIGNYTDEDYACTRSSTAKNLILQFDAPETQYYMGEVSYLVKN